MQVKIPHKLSRDRAIAQVKMALTQNRHKLQEAKAEIHKEEWSDNVLTYDVSVQGQRISGTFTVNDHDFDLYAKLPLMMRMFEGRIEREIAKQAQELIK
jgi:hypothetical protein